MIALDCAQPPDPIVTFSDGAEMSEMPETSAESGDEFYCGNGIVEPGERCDAAGESPTCDANCTDVVCGDGLINRAAGEECERTELDGATCMELGFDGGQLRCDSGCTYETQRCLNIPAAPGLSMDVAPIKRFEFSWAAVEEAEYYEFERSRGLEEPFELIGEPVTGTSMSILAALHLSPEASHRLRACNEIGCTSSDPLAVMGSLWGAVGYFKSPNPDVGEHFGRQVALSDDGSTLAVAAPDEDGFIEGLDNAGAVHVFVRDDSGEWTPQARLTAVFPDGSDGFGAGLSLSADGHTLLIGAPREDSSASGLDGDSTDDSLNNAGAAYVFERNDDGEWSAQTYVKALAPSADDYFGQAVSLSADGNTIAIGAERADAEPDGTTTQYESGLVYVFARSEGGEWMEQGSVHAPNANGFMSFGTAVALSGDGDTMVIEASREDSAATGVDGAYGGAETNSGAAYVFARDDDGGWFEHAYLKASNTGELDNFGRSVAISTDGRTIAVGADGEDSSATGVDGEPVPGATDSGAVYVFTCDDAQQWSPQAYVKASNSGADDRFGQSLALDADGRTLAIGAPHEHGGPIGIGGAPDDTVPWAGAIYLLVRDDSGAWSPPVYIKASNTGEGDRFGSSVALSGDGQTLAVGAPEEAGGAAGVGGDPLRDDTLLAGAVYLY